MLETSDPTVYPSRSMSSYTDGHRRPSPVSFSRSGPGSRCRVSRPTGMALETISRPAIIRPPPTTPISPNNGIRSRRRACLSPVSTSRAVRVSVSTPPWARAVTTLNGNGPPPRASWTIAAPRRRIRPLITAPETIGTPITSPSAVTTFSRRSTCTLPPPSPTCDIDERATSVPVYVTVLIGGPLHR